jgi:hypothetical protein
VLADKAYDADSLRDWLKARRVNAVIPANATRRTPYPLDKIAYKRRNLIERMFCRLKDWRRIATRDDRTARKAAAAVQVGDAALPVGVRLGATEAAVAQSQLDRGHVGKVLRQHGDIGLHEDDDALD